MKRRELLLGSSAVVLGSAFPAEAAEAPTSDKAAQPTVLIYKISEPSDPTGDVLIVRWWYEIRVLYPDQGLVTAFRDAAPFYYVEKKPSERRTHVIKEFSGLRPFEEYFQVVAKDFAEKELQCDSLTDRTTEWLRGGWKVDDDLRNMAHACINTLDVDRLPAEEFIRETNRLMPLAVRSTSSPLGWEIPNVPCRQDRQFRVSAGIMAHNYATMMTEDGPDLWPGLSTLVRI